MHAGVKGTESSLDNRRSSVGMNALSSCYLLIWSLFLLTVGCSKSPAEKNVPTVRVCVCVWEQDLLESALYNAAGKQEAHSAHFLFVAPSHFLVGV